MRQITKESVQALLNGYDMNKANMRVENKTMYLHGNAIAKYENGCLQISHANWETNTTKERLNGISFESTTPLFI